MDLGCGDAALQAELQRRVPELEVTSVDAAALGPGVVPRLWACDWVFLVRTNPKGVLSFKQDRSFVVPL